ncbi:hypothetical protein F7725_012649 [Dissostichus mawsoni]|uniref:TMEM248/TMEM219 domain-containing protein n=1 Tax=Dissostichus mawsoni TaxID=36200 RepID=A0A7J5YR46_DISMA|nr:hypothetical protein F7725_012649 [Dissostichus mawsoni]
MMMGFWQPGTNLRDYVSQNPPLVTFFLCLLTLAISFICFSSYSYTHTVPNPDTVKDWNHLLSSFSEHKLCVQANASLSELVSPVPSPLMDKDSLVSSTKTPLTTLHLKVPLSVTTNSNSGSLKNFALHTAFTASQLHLGVFDRKRILHLPHHKGPAHLLPMKLLPPECPEFKKNISPLHVEVSDKKPAASQTCYSLHSQDDPTLTVMLTQEERNVAVRHLLEVSVCLLGVCLVLCVAASLTQSLIRRHHWNGLDIQNEPLMDT